MGQYAYPIPRSSNLDEESSILEEREKRRARETENMRETEGGGRWMEIRQTHLLAEYQETMGEKMKRRQNYDNIKILWETEKKREKTK